MRPSVNLSSNFVAIYYAQRGLQLAKKTKYHKYYANALSVHGSVNRRREFPHEALVNIELCYTIRKSIGDSSGMHKILGNIGNLYQNSFDDSDKCLEYYGRSLEIQKKLKLKKSIGRTYINMSTTNLDKGEHLKALECYTFEQTAPN